MTTFPSKSAVTTDFTVSTKFVILVGMVLMTAACSSTPAQRPVSPNAAPVAVAAQTESLPVGRWVQLDGTGSHDPDGDALTYKWSLVSKPSSSAAYLDSASSLRPKFYADVPGNYTVALTINDGKTDSEVATVSITASAELPPSAPRLSLSPPFDAPSRYSLGSYQVDAITSTYIAFNRSAGDLCDPVLYDRNFDNFNFDSLYKVSTQSGKTYYFRFGSQSYTTFTTFGKVAWADDTYPTESGIMKFDIVEKSIIQNGNNEISMVGDSITWWNNGETFRYALARKNSTLKFVGTRTDIYGYGHEGEGGNNTQQVIDRLQYILPSSNYMVLIGTNDRISTNATLANMQIIANGLLAKTPQTNVYFVTLLPRNDIYDAKNVEINSLLRSWITSSSNPKLHLIDIESDIRSIPSWQSLFPDNVHPSPEGYDLLTTAILSKVGPW